MWQRFLLSLTIAAEHTHNSDNGGYPMRESTSTAIARLPADNQNALLPKRQHMIEDLESRLSPDRVVTPRGGPRRPGNASF
jgi:hypothetical protein